MSMTVSAETDAERLDRLEMEIKEIKALEPSTAEDVWAKYNMRIYGRVKVDLNYDTTEFKQYNDFIGVVKEDASNDSVNFNPRDTRFGLEASHTDGNWTGKGRFEIDFYGTNSGNSLIPRMRLGYVDLANNSSGTSLRVGQDWIPVAQQNPATIDFGVLTANATDDLGVSAGYGIDDPKNDDMKTMRGTLGDRQFTRNDIAFVNSWYNVTKAAKVGAEVMYVKTERFDNTDEGMRYTLSTFYNF